MMLYYKYNYHISIPYTCMCNSYYWCDCYHCVYIISIQVYLVLWLDTVLYYIVVYYTILTILCYLLHCSITLYYIITSCNLIVGPAGKCRHMYYIIYYIISYYTVLYYIIITLYIYIYIYTYVYIYIYMHIHVYVIYY